MASMLRNGIDPNYQHLGGGLYATRRTASLVPDHDTIELPRFSAPRLLGDVLHEDIISRIVNYAHLRDQWVAIDWQRIQSDLHQEMKDAIAYRAAMKSYREEQLRRESFLYRTLHADVEKPAQRLPESTIRTALINNKSPWVWLRHELSTMTLEGYIRENVSRIDQQNSVYEPTQELVTLLARNVSGATPLSAPQDDAIAHHQRKR